jgi:hypothetical protein
MEVPTPEPLSVSRDGPWPIEERRPAIERSWYEATAKPVVAMAAPRSDS